MCAVKGAPQTVSNAGGIQAPARLVSSRIHSASWRSSHTLRSKSVVAGCSAHHAHLLQGHQVQRRLQQKQSFGTQVHGPRKILFHLPVIATERGKIEICQFTSR